MPKYALELYNDENLSSVKNCPIERYGIDEDDSISIPFKVYEQTEVDELLSNDRSKLNELQKQDIKGILEQLQKELEPYLSEVQIQVANTIFNKLKERINE